MAMREWHLQADTGDSTLLDPIGYDLSSGYAMGRDDFSQLSSDITKFVSRKQAVLHEASDGTHIVCTSTGANPTAIKPAGSNSWKRLVRGEVGRLYPGDSLALTFSSFPRASPFVLRQTTAGEDEMDGALQTSASPQEPVSSIEVEGQSHCEGRTSLDAAGMADTGSSEHGTLGKESNRERVC